MTSSLVAVTVAGDDHPRGVVVVEERVCAGMANAWHTRPREFRRSAIEAVYSDRFRHCDEMLSDICFDTLQQR
jgi:hypothetical protein